MRKTIKDILVRLHCFITLKLLACFPELKYEPVAAPRPSAPAAELPEELPEFQVLDIAQSSQNPNLSVLRFRRGFVGASVNMLKSVGISHIYVDWVHSWESERGKGGGAELLYCIERLAKRNGKAAIFVPRPEGLENAPRLVASLLSRGYVPYLYAQPEVRTRLLRKVL